jgi:catechol 2,3-dioxygenase-like lactoylglutathione lyase family enzyme
MRPYNRATAPWSIDMQLGHVGLFVMDFQRMLDFYTDIFGFVLTDISRNEKRSIAFLTTDPLSHHQLVIASGRTQEVDSRKLINQLSFRVPDLATVKRIYARLVDSPARELDPITHGTAWSVYFRDPEDNRVEAYADTPWYITQPHRTPIDLTKPESQIYAETEALCRAQPGFEPLSQWSARVAKVVESGGLGASDK